MPGWQVGVATCALAPDLDEDAALLLGALRHAGVDPHPAVWDDPTVEWDVFDGVLVRSVWDYPAKRDEFLQWSRGCRVTANPRAVLAWNTDKRYLTDLSAAGVPTVPTVFVPPGAAFEAPSGDYVVKPSVSSSARDTGRFRGADDAVDLVAKLHAEGRTVMVQPFLPGIDEEGETSIIFLGGEYSHAVRRQPLLTERGVRRPVVVADVLSTVRAVDPTDAQLDVATRALSAAPGGRLSLSYARVDLIPGVVGPAVLELEATDCFLFLSFAAQTAIDRLAVHVRNRIANSSGGIAGVTPLRRASGA